MKSVTDDRVASDSELIDIRQKLVADLQSPRVSQPERRLGNACLELLEKVMTSRGLTVLHQGR